MVRTKPSTSHLLVSFWLYFIVTNCTSEWPNSSQLWTFSYFGCQPQHALSQTTSQVLVSAPDSNWAHHTDANPRLSTAPLARETTWGHVERLLLMPLWWSGCAEFIIQHAYHLPFSCFPDILDICNSISVCVYWHLLLLSGLCTHSSLLPWWSQESDAPRARVQWLKFSIWKNTVICLLCYSVSGSQNQWTCSVYCQDYVYQQGRFIFSLLRDPFNLSIYWDSIYPNCCCGFTRSYILTEPFLVSSNGSLLAWWAQGAKQTHCVLRLLLLCLFSWLPAVPRSSQKDEKDESKCLWCLTSHFLLMVMAE